MAEPDHATAKWENGKTELGGQLKPVGAIAGMTTSPWQLLLAHLPQRLLWPSCKSLVGLRIKNQVYLTYRALVPVQAAPHDRCSPIALI